jgi:ketosteroid isomerase-like protein
MLKRTVLLLLTASMAWPQGDGAENAIRAARLGSNRAIVAHDIKSFADSLAPDFVMIRGNGVLVPSRQEYIEMFAQDFADPKAMRYERIPDKIEISTAAPMAAEHGHWIGTLSDGTRAYGGTYLAMWQNAGGAWKIRSELFVTLWCEDGAACKGYLTRTPAP